MKLNGIAVKPSRIRRKAIQRKVYKPNRDYCRCRWESSDGSTISVHRCFRMAVQRAVDVNGVVRVVTYSPDGIVHHGEWRRV